MNIDDITVGEAKKLANMFADYTHRRADDGAHNCWERGKNYLIRTVTMTLTGKLVAVGAQEIGLKDAAWIADTGRYADNVVSCEFNEVEPYPDGLVVIVGRGSIVDAVQIDKLPRKQK
jgi:hypothetical protein